MMRTAVFRLCGQSSGRTERRLPPSRTRASGRQVRFDPTKSLSLSEASIHSSAFDFFRPEAIERPAIRKVAQRPCASAETAGLSPGRSLETRRDGRLTASTISTRRFCGSRTPSAVCTSGWVSPLPTTEIAGRRHAVAHQRVLDRVGAAQRQRHVVVLRTRRVGVAGRRDAGTAALVLIGLRHLADASCSACCRQVRAIPVEEHHERRRGGPAPAAAAAAQPSGWPNL